MWSSVSNGFRLIHVPKAPRTQKMRPPPFSSSFFSPLIPPPPRSFFSSRKTGFAFLFSPLLSSPQLPGGRRAGKVCQTERAYAYAVVTQVLRTGVASPQPHTPPPPLEKKTPVALLATPERNSIKRESPLISRHHQTLFVKGGRRVRKRTQCDGLCVCVSLLCQLEVWEGRGGIEEGKN